MIKPIVVLGIFVADATQRASRQPKIGETLLANSFALGPGGKGSNQAVAAGRLGGNVAMLTRLGVDTFAQMAKDIWAQAGVTSAAIDTPTSYTGAAHIFIEDATGNNAITVSPGAASLLTPQDIEDHASLIKGASVFITQLEQPLDAAIAGLKMAKGAGVTTILNPAPAAALPDEVYRYCDYITPNESEAQGLTGIAVNTIEDARRAGDALLAKGCGTALITLGEKGVLLHNKTISLHIPALNAGPVVETTGAGDAFNGGFAYALAKGQDASTAATFANAVAAISVTRPGAAASMPSLEDVQRLMRG
jgi:ribokinase